MSQTITLFHLLAALAALYLPFVCVTDYHFRIGGFCVFFFVVFEVSYLVVFGVWYQYLVAPDSHHPATVHPDNANIHSLQIHLLQLLPHIKPSGGMSGKTLFALIRHLVCLSFLASIITKKK